MSEIPEWLKPLISVICSPLTDDDTEKYCCEVLKKITEYTDLQEIRLKLLIWRDTQLMEFREINLAKYPNQIKYPQQHLDASLASKTAFAWAKTMREEVKSAAAAAKTGSILKDTAIALSPYYEMEREMFLKLIRGNF